MATESKDVFAALVEFQKEMPTVTRNTEGQAGQRRYKYADLTDIITMCTPVLTAHGLAFVCAPHKTEDGTYETVGMIVHKSGTMVEGSLPIFGRTAQEIGSSLTYNRRYLFGNLTGIVTDEDDDAASAQRAGQTRPQQTPITLAKESVWATWRVAHPDGTADGLKADYFNRYERPLESASVADLTSFADALKAEIAEGQFARSMGATTVETQELPEGATS